MFSCIDQIRENERKKTAESTQEDDVNRTYINQQLKLRDGHGVYLIRFSLLDFISFN